MNKKMLVTSAILLVVAFALVGGPIDLLVNFMLAGTIPGVKLTAGPYIVLLITLAGSLAMAVKMFHLALPSIGKKDILQSFYQLRRGRRQTAVKAD